MYRERTQKDLRKRLFMRIGIALCIVLVFALAFFSYGQIRANLRQQGEASLRNSILDGAKQCCAIEGSYPSSLAYLEDNYGIVVDKDSYVVFYQAVGGNVLPSVMVTAK